MTNKKLNKVLIGAGLVGLALFIIKQRDRAIEIKAVNDAKNKELQTNKGIAVGEPASTSTILEPVNQDFKQVLVQDQIAGSPAVYDNRLVSTEYYYNSQPAPIYYKGVPMQVEISQADF